MGKKVTKIVSKIMIMAIMAMTFTVACATAIHYEHNMRNHGCSVLFATGIECMGVVDSGIAQMDHSLALREMMIQSIVTNDSVARAIILIFFIFVTWWYFQKTVPLFIKRLRLHVCFHRLCAVSLAIRRCALLCWIIMHIRLIPSRVFAGSSYD